MLDPMLHPGSRRPLRLVQPPGYPLHVCKGAAEEKAGAVSRVNQAIELPEEEFI